jgi:hypothetical protein
MAGASSNAAVWTFVTLLLVWSSIWFILRTLSTHSLNFQRFAASYQVTCTFLFGVSFFLHEDIHWACRNQVSVSPTAVSMSTTSSTRAIHQYGWRHRSWLAPWYAMVLRHPHPPC